MIDFVVSAKDFKRDVNVILAGREGDMKCALPRVRHGFSPCEILETAAEAE